MAQSDAQDRKSRMEKAEGDRREDTRYEDRGERVGITNQPVPDEVEGQEHASEPQPSAERQQH